MSDKLKHCANCEFCAEELNPNGTSFSHRCHLNPPIVEGTEHETSGALLSTYYGFPVVKPNVHWCSHFKLKTIPNKIRRKEK